MLFGNCMTKQSFTSKNKTHQIPKGIRAFINDSLYNFDTDYTLSSTDIFPDSFQYVHEKRDTLYSVYIAGIITNNLEGHINSTRKIRVSVGFKHHDVTPGTYFHDYDSSDDTLCGIFYSNKCYDYFMPNKLNPNYNVTIISIDSTSVQGTFIGQVDAFWYDKPNDSTNLCKVGLRPKEKLMIRGEFNVPVKKKVIIHKRNEPTD
jgi:hypothetical protein